MKKMEKWKKRTSQRLTQLLSVIKTAADKCTFKNNMCIFGIFQMFSLETKEYTTLILYYA